MDIQRLFDSAVVVQSLRPLRGIRVLTQLTAERQLPGVTSEETVFAVTFFHEMVSLPTQNEGKWDPTSLVLRKRTRIETNVD